VVSPPRVAIVSDYLEENWRSMDLVADMLARELRIRHGAKLRVCQLRPRFRWRFGRFHFSGGERTLFKADRLLNRFVDYPRFLRARKRQFDLFHIVDHSYAHLVSAAGPERSIVTCHDVDTFRCIVEPGSEDRSWLFRNMAKRVLKGFCEAAAIACVSSATRHQILRLGLVPADRLTVNPNGVSEPFNPRADTCADMQVCDLLGAPDLARPEILHVGTTNARKRIDVLLRVFAALRGELPHLRLVRVGGAFSTTQRELMNQLALPPESVVVLPSLSREVLAAVYRHAALVVLPSEAEGFGLPALEAMACGTPVLASDISALREVGGPAAAYCPVADLDRWTATTLELLRERREYPRSWAQRSAAGVKWAARFTWHEYADRALDLYRSLAPVPSASARAANS